MAADQDPQPGARAAAGLFGELQRYAVGGHDVVAPDGAFVDDITEGRHNNGADLVMSALSAWRTAELPFGLEPVV
jgi:hypothetical protein